jgi:hypothetical protein
MPVLYLHTTESSTGGEPENDEKWCHHSDILKAVSFNSVSRSNNSFWGCAQSFDVTEEVFKADQVFLVIVRYYDGGTFGRTCGNYNVQGSFLTEKEALDFAESIENGTYQKEAEKARKKSKSNFFGGPYMPWVGYFSGLEGVEVHCFTVQNESGNKSRNIIYH